MSHQSLEIARQTSPLKRRQPQALSQPLGKRLLAYATVAGAGVASCARPAEAKIVYTPVHSGLHGSYPLDVNNDGIDDFVISSYYLSVIGRFTVKPRISGNKVAAEGKDCLYETRGAAALPVGIIIGPGLFQNTATCMAALTSGFTNGPWLGVKEHYLGLAFLINGELHYGWARLSFNSFYCYTCIARIQGYAYESVPDKPIKAGDEGNAEEATVAPGSLGMLALGAPGINLWRSEP